VLQDCVAIRQKKLPGHWATFDALGLLGEALAGQKQYAKAEPVLKKAYEGLRANRKAIPPAGAKKVEEAVERLIRLYDSWGKPDEAASWRKLRVPG
jgi:hypothetical protein